jgi:formylglycine-generating enzyme required for sulfatase activity
MDLLADSPLIGVVRGLVASGPGIADSAATRGRPKYKQEAEAMPDQAQTAFPLGKASDWCPEMVLLPAGTFLMGSPDDERGRLVVEGPQQSVTIEKSFAVGRYAITVDQFAAFVADSERPVGTTCKQWSGTDWHDRPGSFRSPGFVQSGDHPAVCVSWEDAMAYVGWLSSRSGRRFRLLTEAEWEYAARGCTVTPFWWGEAITPNQANGNFSSTADPDSKGDLWRQRTLPVDSFEPNPWGIYQVHGNVWEWVEDCWNDSHAGGPTNGGARQGPSTCKRVLRGGSWLNRPQGLRSARRHAAERGYRRSDIGFRVAESV